MFIPVPPGNILIALPTLPVCISLTSAHGSGFCCIPACRSICSSPLASRLSQARPHDAGGVWPMGAPWPCRSIHPSLPLEPFPGAAQHELESKGNISVVASGCSWLPPFPWIQGARVPLGLPQLLVMPCLQLSEPPRGACPGPNPEEPLFLRACVCGWHLPCCARSSRCAKPRGGALGVPSFPRCILCSQSCWGHTIPGEMCPLKGPDPAQNPAKGLSPCLEAVTLPWGGVWVEAGGGVQHGERGGEVTVTE